MRFLRSFLAGALRLRLTLAAVLVAAALLPAAPAHAQFLAGQLESLLSTDDRQVRIEGLSGALSGNLRIAQVTVADRDGIWLTARDLALDWSPLALVRANISVEALQAGQIVLDRLPRAASTPAEPDDAGGFSLPSITADIRRIAINEFVLGAAVAGVPARLSAEASLGLQPDPARLDASATIRRLDQPGTVALRIGFQPDANRLEIQVDASEPAGGIVAGLLRLPGAPPVTLNITGSGPFDDFAATGALDLAGARAATLEATVRNGPEGRRITAGLAAQTQPFVPEAYRGVVGDEMRLDADVLLTPQGPIRIDTGRLASGALQLSANGTYDGGGAGNDLALALRTAGGDPIAFGFGSGDGRTAFEIAQLDATLRGAIGAAAIDASLAARTAGYGAYTLNEATATVRSAGFDLVNLAGPIAAEIGARNASVSGTAAGGVPLIASRLLEGPSPRHRA